MGKTMIPRQKQQNTVMLGYLYQGIRLKHITDKIAMSQHDALRFSRRAGRIDNIRHLVSRNRRKYLIHVPATLFHFPPNSLTGHTFYPLLFPVKKHRFSPLSPAPR